MPSIAKRHTKRIGKPGSTKKKHSKIQRRTYMFAETGEELPYAVFIPSDASSSKPMPMLLALHGHAYPYDWAMSLDGLLSFAAAHGMLVVAPLGHSETGWYGTPCLPRGGVIDKLSEADVLNVLDLVEREFEVDPLRRFAWGFSMGGGGALHFALKQPDFFRGIGLVAPAIGAVPRMLPPDGFPPWTRKEGFDLGSIRA